MVWRTQEKMQCVGVPLAAFILMLLVSCTAMGPDPEVGSPVCLKDKNNTLLMRFTAKLNADNITHVFAFRNNGSSLEPMDCSHTIQTFHNLTFLVVESRVNLNNLSDAEASNPCGFTEELISGNMAVSYRLALRRRFGFVTVADKDYTFACMNTTMIGTHLVANVTVLTPDTLVTLPAAKHTVTLDVVSSSSRTIVQQCALGDSLKLGINMLIEQPYRDYLTPWGLYAYRTVFAATEADLNDPAKTRPLTDDNGCIVTNSLDMTTGFTRNTSLSNSTMARYESSDFICRRFVNTNTVWFATSYKLCHGPIGEDAKCKDYCSSPRKKRSLDQGSQQGQGSKAEDLQLITVLNIVGDDEEDSNQSPEIRTDDDVMGISRPLFFGVLAICSAILTIVTVAVVCMCLWMGQRRSHGDTDSMASGYKLPVKS